ncbi:MAG: magnesium/cobalt transporter CorA [Planctomycetota bacterium]
MRLARKRAAKDAGLPPGTPVYVGERKVEKVRVSVTDYDADHCEQREVEGVEEVLPCRETATVTWINVDGLHDVELIEKLGEAFGLHPLVREDIVNTGQRPKLEEYENCLYVTVRMFTRWDGEFGLEGEQVSLVLGPGFVISFQERAGDVFDPVRERIRTGRGRVRQGGADYLFYALLDAVVDGYFVTCEQLGEHLEAMEEELLSDPRPQSAARIHRLKRQVIFLRKSIWPLREVLGGLTRGEAAMIEEETELFLRDAYDHAIQVMDTIESSRDILSGLLDIYLSSISNRMNEVMKVLTIIATIFIPVTFIAGVYGMNFDHMPELHWRWSYPVVLLIMAAMAAGMLVYFRRKDWI